MKYLLICLLFASCGTRIYQETEDCGSGHKFQVRTWINKGLTQTIYTAQTWTESGYKCLEVYQVDSAKKAEYTKAEEWLKVYNKIE